MKIETEFDLGDTVWFVDGDNVSKGIVDKIRVCVSKDRITIPWFDEYYLIADEKGEALLNEMTAENYFRTRKEAIDELEKRYELNIRRLRAQDRAEGDKR